MVVLRFKTPLSPPNLWRKMPMEKVFETYTRYKSFFAHLFLNADLNGQRTKRIKLLIRKEIETNGGRGDEMIFIDLKIMLSPYITFSIIFSSHVTNVCK